MKPLKLLLGIRKKSVYQISVLVLSWVLGSLSSLLFAKHYCFSLMCPLTVERVSIVGMIVSLTLPFILSYILLNRCHFLTIIPVLFLKAFGYMFCYYSITYFYGTAGWLVRLFLMFSDTFSVFILLHFCYRFASGKTDNMLRYFQIAFMVLILFCCLDYYVISPFSMMLINY